MYDFMYKLLYTVYISYILDIYSVNWRYQSHFEIYVIVLLKTYTLTNLLSLIGF